MMETETHPDVWPLKRGETLSNHDWFPMNGHKFMGSRFLSLAIMEDRRADIGTGVILWIEAVRQDPAGTLPDCDVQLADLAKFRSVDEWRAVRSGVLRGWHQVLVEDDDRSDPIVRLGHPSLLRDVVSMYKRKRGRDAARVAGNLGVKRSRIRKKMEELQVEAHIIADDRVIHELVEHFEASGLFITHDNVRTAMVEAIGYTGQVRRFPKARSS